MSIYQKPSFTTIKAILTDGEFQVTQNNATEPPFDNKYWDNQKDGIYVDIVTGEPLFSSTDKFDSGTGWPSFRKPIVENCLAELVDFKLSYQRIEVKSLIGDSHLGHLFNEADGLRYCINSASLRFIKVADLSRLGYGEFLVLFK